jgi:YVTN family beta-propeller protein
MRARRSLRVLTAVVALVLAGAGAAGTVAASAAEGDAIPPRTPTRGAVATISVGLLPSAIAMSPSGGRVYVTSRGDARLTVIDTSTNTVIGSMTEGTDPTDITVSPDGALFISQARGSVDVVDPVALRVMRTISVPGAPISVALNRAGTRLYVADFRGGNLVTVDTSNERVISSVRVGKAPVDVTLNPAGTVAYVTHRKTAVVTVVDTVSNSVIARITSGLRGVATRTVVEPVAPRAYVTLQAGLRQGSVAVVDTRTNRVTGHIQVGYQPTDMAFDAEGTRGYVVNSYSSLTVIDTVSGTVVRTIHIGGTPRNLVIGPRGERAYVTVMPETVRVLSLR